MFKRILLPTDGSAFSFKGVEAGLRFAKEIGADAIGLFVIQPVTQMMLYEGMSAVSAATQQSVEAANKAQAERVIATFNQLATAAGVKIQSYTVTEEDIAGTVAGAAREYGCDLIFIGSHGRRGLTKLLLGSVTAKMLPQAPVPVLVWREGE